MGTIIKSVAVAKPFFRNKILPLAVISVKCCLKKSGIDIEHVGMLINTSIYTENYLREPALASLIQKKIQSNPLRKKFRSGNSNKIFSFDLHRGGSGIIAAFQLIDGFIQTGEIQNAIVVGGDVKPVSGYTENFNYSSGAAAVLLSKIDGNKGFVHFRTDTYPEYIHDLESSTNWDSGKFKFGIHQGKDFLNNCVSCALVSISKFFKEKEISWEQIDLVITSQIPTGFTELLKRQVGLNNKVVDISGNRGFYSAGLLFSLNRVFRNPKFTSSKNVLFLTVGAGITVSLTLYKN
jgi:3-oxoacyl-[acyl-carrier-protein] synthase III